MDPVQTLHDFTLNLLSDPMSLAAFAQDPQAALQAAGLGDISAADVHEVMPLVLDYIPVDDLGSLGNLPQAGDLTGVLADGPQGAIEQLQALTASLGLPGVDGLSVPALPAVPGLPALPAVGELPAVGDLPVVGELPAVGALSGVTDLQNTAAGVTALAQDPTSAFGLVNDLSGGLDAGAVSGAVAQVQDVAGQVTGAVDGSAPLHASDLPVAGGAMAPVGGLTSNLAQSATGVEGHVSDLAGSVTDQVGNLTNGLGGLDHAVGGVTNEVQGLTHSVVPDLGGERADAHTGTDAHAGTDAGLGAVHDTVSTVTDLGQHTLGLDLQAGAETSHGGAGLDLHL
ncbi:IniB N-terminal domain-containing protein [Amycolatopsis sp. NPDC047767]|uniref:IniB N-terminal domain-containing protein n=1 Tax=Amycolatopsis sp. NPDC047767 TaxID=3156765 RepID=UPI003454B818